MRKIMLLMSLICLTALAVGCEDNNMVVLMCDGGACPDGGGGTENNPVTGEGTPCDDAEYLKICNGNSYLYCNNGMTAFQSCRENQICKTGEGCVDNAKPLCGPKDRCDGGSCECPEEQTCENGTCVDKPKDPCAKCTPEQTCEAGKCVDNGGQCTGDNCGNGCNCADGETCDGKGNCVKDEVVSCVDSQSCDECDCRSPMKCDERNVCVKIPSGPGASECDGDKKKCDGDNICVRGECHECRDGEIRCDGLSDSQYNKCIDGKWSNGKNGSCKGNYKCINGVCMNADNCCIEVGYSGVGIVSGDINTKCGVDGKRYKCDDGYYVLGENLQCEDKEVCVREGNYTRCVDRNEAWANEGETCQDFWERCSSDGMLECAYDAAHINGRWKLSENNRCKVDEICVTNSIIIPKLTYSAVCEEKFEPKYMCKNGAISFVINNSFQPSVLVDCKEYGRTCDPDDPNPRCIRIND